MSNVVPDAVDQEVGNFWRSLYKLERGFENVATARKIAQKACACACASAFASPCPVLILGR